ncbi:hypothetical protein [Sphingopyxis sp.]|uniref:hypothetical protein n=1 Tax=Sphingopyxis sp. TaxID=1908224 RepID=UPI0035B48CA4
MTPVVVIPVYGWGFLETIDGELADPFEINISETGVNVGQPGLGWRGKVSQAGHKYDGMTVSMHPRHVEWTGVVVLDVTSGGATIYNGFAHTEGLECNWK